MIDYSTGNKSKTHIKEFLSNGIHSFKKIDFSTDVIDTNIGNGDISTAVDNYIRKLTSLVGQVSTNFTIVSSNMKTIDSVVKSDDGGKRTSPSHYSPSMSGYRR